VEINRAWGSEKIHKAFSDSKLLKKWYGGFWGKKILQKKKKGSFSDFENFKFMIGKKHKSSSNIIFS